MFHNLIKGLDMATFLVWLYLVFLVLFVVASFSFGIDFLISRIFNVAPEVPSSRRLRNAVINEIKNNYADKKSVIDIGSCYGGLARKIARNFRNMDVTGVEKMPMPCLVSKMADAWCIGVPNSKTRFGDAFKFIKKSDGFDIGVTYLLRPMMGQVEELRDKFDVLIVMDFPLPNIEPTRKIKLHFDLLGQHWLYVYEKKGPSFRPSSENQK